MSDFNFQEVACKVYSILLEFPDTRDCDKRLLGIIWRNELEGNEFFQAFDDGKLSNPETVCRVRRKLQEVHSDLRGEKWDSRHNFEGAVCQQLTFFDRW